MNDNKVFDEDTDLFIGTLDEIEDGIYQLDKLKYDGFFYMNELHRITSQLTTPIII